MSYYTGTHGRMEIRKGNQFNEDNTVPQLHVRNWQVTTSISQLDATTLADTDKVPVNGIRTTRGSCNILYYKEPNKDSSIKRLIERLVKERNDTDWDGTRPGVAEEAGRCFLHLYVAAEGNANVGYTLQANLTSYSMTCAVGDIVTCQIQFESIGAPLAWNP